MKKFGTMLAVLLIFLMPFVALKAKRDAERKMRRPDVGIIRTESAAKPGDTVNARKKAESVPMPKYTVQEQIAAMNAGYKQMWEQEQTRIPKADAPAVRYAISDEERREIERIVASEGGYCGYEFQALVAECILNGCEAEGMRPLELFERGDFWITHNVAPDKTTKKAVSEVFDRGIMPTAEKVRYYYNPNYSESAMHEQMCYVLTCCDCRFFKDWE